MNLLESLLDAIIRLDGDALVMHVGEKPYVVTTSMMNAYRGPLAWGQVELSSRVLTADAVLGMLGQILPLEQRQALDELGAVEHEIRAAEHASEHFTVVAARSGDDVWLEVRRHLGAADVNAQPAPIEEPMAAPEPNHEEAPAAPEMAAPAARIAEAEPLSAEQQEAVPEEVAVEETVAVGPTRVPDIEVGRPEEFEQVVEVPGFLDVSPDLEIAVDDAGDVVPPPTEETVVVIAEEREQTPFEIVHEVAQGFPTHEDVEALLAASAESLLGAVVPGASAEEEPVAGEPIAPEAVTPEPVAEEPIAPEAVTPEPVAEEPIAPEAVTPEPVAEEPIAPEAVAPEPVAEEPIAPEPVVPEPVAEEPIVREPVVPEPVATEAEPEPMAEPRVVVVPLSRVPVRVASSQSPAAASTITVDEVLRIAAARGASAVYVVAQSTPMVRTDGEISALEVGDGEPLTQADIERIVLELSPPPHDAAASDAPVEWMCDVPGVGRVRCLTFHDHRGPGVILRMIPHRAISADQLGLSAEVQALCTQSDGLVLVTGPRASGKTTLMNAFVDLINRTRSDHVITIEPQIGFVHESRRCFISQREVRGDTAATLASLKAALREGPDVLFIEDVAAADIAIAAMQAAEAGRLVFASMSSPSTTAAIERLLESLPAERRAQAQGSLAASLRGVVSQVFVRRTKGGRLAAREVLLNTPAVAGLIQDGRLNQLRRAMESGGKLGMVLLSDALAVLVRDGTVHVTEAYRRAVDKEALLAALKREGIDTSFAEKLA